MRDQESHGTGWERSDEMLTRNAMGSWKRAPLLGFAAACAALIGLSAVAQAQPKSDEPAGYVVLPKVIVHTTGGTPPVAPVAWRSTRSSR